MVEEGADYCGSRRRQRSAARTDRHLRRPPHGDVLLARLAGRRRPVRINDPDASPRPFPTISSVLAGIARALMHDAPDADPGHRHRRADGIGQGHGRAGSPQRLGFHYSIAARLPPGRAGRAARAASSSTDEHAVARLAEALDARFANGDDLSGDRRRRDRDPRGGGRATRLEVRRLPAVRQALCDASGPSACRPAWSRTGATWGPSFSRRHAQNLPDRRAPKRARNGAISN